MFRLLSLLVAVLAVAIPAATLAAASGRIARNPFVGIRIRWTMLDADTWRIGHRAAARVSWWAMLPAFVLAVAGLFTQRPWLTVLDFIAVLLLIGGLVWMSVVANNAALTAVGARPEGAGPVYRGGGSSQE